MRPTPASARRLGSPQQRHKPRKILGGDIGHRPERHSVRRPPYRVEPTRRSGARRRFARPGRDCESEYVDRVLRALVDERGGGTAIDVIEPAADEREALRREVAHWRREVEL